MIRIGDFSKLSRLPIKTLRYYDEVGLLEPVHVDNFTGYRYYAYEQVGRLNRILALKDLGFSLEQIGQLLDEGLSLEQMRGMLILRRSEIRQKVQEEAARLERVEARLRQIEQEAEMSKYDVVIKSVDAVKVASLRDVVPTPPDQRELWEELGRYLIQQDVKTTEPCFSLYHDEGFKEQDWDIEICEPLAGDLKETERIKVKEVPAVECMACTVHHGAFVSIGDAYDALAKWISENHYQIVGSAREVYLREARSGNQNDPETLTEVQFPVEKG
jgi:effector-binding domain-containing protein